MPWYYHNFTQMIEGKANNGKRYVFISIFVDVCFSPSSSQIFKTFLLFPQLYFNFAMSTLDIRQPNVFILGTEI